jgi:hypothetical protein
MAIWKVSPKDKKSINEHELWQKDDQVIRIITGWRFGSYFVTTEDDNPPVFEENDGPYETGINLYESDYEVELDYTSDGWYTDIIWPDEMPEEERDRIYDLWLEDSYSGLEDDGWVNYDTEVWLLGEIEVSKEEE